MIAATLIARDEERCIARCLDSVKPWVDRILVLDTGSRDATVEIAQDRGAEVHHFTWCDDFAQARNRALDLAAADWHLIIDADEWIVSGGEGLRSWCAGSPRLGRVCVSSSFEDASAGTLMESRSWITRVLPGGVRFRGRVHEQAISPLPRERIDLTIGHDGYLEAQMARKHDRNRPLLLLDLQDHPDDPYIAFQLGREAEGDEAFTEACEWYGRALAAAPVGEGWLNEAQVRQLHSLGRAGQLDAALTLAWDRMEAMAESPDFFFTFGNLLLDRAMADPGQAVEQWLPLAAAAWERCLEIGERPEQEGSVHGRGSHLAQHNLDALRAQLAGLRG